MIDPRPTLDAPDDDPYLWLEEVDGERALVWVEAQNAATLTRFGDSRFAADRDTLAAIFDRPDKMPLIARRGPVLQFLDGCRPSPRPLAAHDARELPPRAAVVGGPARSRCVREREAEDWIWSGATTRPGSHDRAIVGLSRGGSDAVVLREFDLAMRELSYRTVFLPEAKGGAAGSIPTPCCCPRPGAREWRPIRVMPGRYDCGGARPTRSGAGALRECRREHVGRGRSRSASAGYVWFADRLGFFDEIVRIGDDTGPKTRIRPADRCSGRMASRLDHDQAAHGVDDWRQNLSAATRSWASPLRLSWPATAISPNCSSQLSAGALQDFFWCGSRLVLSILDNLQAGVRSPDPAGCRLARERS